MKKTLLFGGILLFVLFILFVLLSSRIIPDRYSFDGYWLSHHISGSPVYVDYESKTWQVLHGNRIENFRIENIQQISSNEFRIYLSLGKSTDLNLDETLLLLVIDPNTIKISDPEDKNAYYVIERCPAYMQGWLKRVFNFYLDNNFIRGYESRTNALK